MKNQNWISKDASGIENYYNPIFDQHTIYTPYRSAPIFTTNKNVKTISPTNAGVEEHYCPFCLGESSLATPEKLRAVKSQEQISYIPYPTLQDDSQNVLFRRQANLFEIICYDYWQDKYNIITPQEDLERIDKAFDDPQLKSSLEGLLQLNLQKNNQNIKDFSIAEQKKMCEYFYNGFHELLTSGRHYLPQATNSSELFHSGYIPWSDHRVSFEMICNAMTDMCARNPFITFITVFQNWLSEAGASIEHWHKQMLGIDFWGHVLLREASLTKDCPTFYRDFICETVNQENLLIAENKHAFAYIEIGSKTGRITICSKSKNLRPQEHTLEEIHAMSDLTHAVLSTITPLTPYNEKWFYTPFHQEDFVTPWRISISLRANVNAGFENITQKLINPISPKKLADAIRNLMISKSAHFAPNITITSKNISPDIFQYILKK